MAKGINGQTPSVESLQPKLQSNSEPQGFIGWYQLIDITSVTAHSSSCKASSCETKEMMLQGLYQKENLLICSLVSVP